MRKRYLIFGILFAFKLQAQQANDWIQFNGSLPYSSQQYFKIKVWKNGIYKLDYLTLQAAGFPVGADPHKFQIFHNGREQYIYVSGESDSVFDPSDYIEFYGQKNDGKIDAVLYENPPDHLNPDYSLFCDTSAYFLTVSFFGVNAKRMILETDINFSAYTPQDFITRQVRRNYLGLYLEGDQFGNLDPSYSGPEGFSGTAFDISSTDNFPTPNVSSFSAAPLPDVSLRLVNANNDNAYHTFNFSLNGNTLFTDNSIVGYSSYNYAFTVPVSALLASNALVYSGFVNTVGVNRMSVTYLNLRYSHANTFAGETDAFQFFYTSGPGSKVRLDLNDYLVADNGTRYIYILEGDTVKRVSTVRTGNLVQAIVPVGGAERHCLLTSSMLSYSTLSDFMLMPVNTSSDPTVFSRFTNFSYNSPNYDYLIVSHKNLWSGAVAYKNFRIASGFNPLLADIDELYDQFAFGVYKHPLAIKNFCRYALQNFSNVKYLLLIGKGIYPKDVRTSPADAALDLVPTYGSPPTDLMFSNKISDSTYAPALATGRIAAWNMADLDSYLAKIQEHDAALQSCPQDWMKHALHFIGGDAGFEQGLIKNYMDANEAVIKDTLTGFTVTSYYKTSTDPIQYLQALELQARIDSGVSIMNFFGHAAGSSFDITTDIPQNWHNQGRYPMVFAQSCLVGDIFGSVRNLNEQFVLLPNKGSVGFLAKPNQGNIDELGDYSKDLYKNVAFRDYGEGIGVAAQHATDSLLSQFEANGSIFIKSTALGMILHGDPALRVVPSALPDLMISQPSVYFNPTEVSTDLNSFEMNVIVSNLGKAVSDSVNVRVVRKFQDGSPSVSVDTIIKYVAFKDTITFTFPVQAASASGFNYFDVFVNYVNLNVQECNAANNRIFDLPLQIISTDITPVYPFKYAIVPDANVIVKASIDNIFASSKTYRFELDTTDSFNTPFLRSTTFTQTGGVIKWPLPFTCDSGKVYYWRVSLDPSLYPNEYRWKESSFVFMPALTGWSQAHFFQFKDDKYSNIIYNKPQRIWEFSNTQSELRANNLKFPAPSGKSIDVLLNNELVATGGCSFDGFHVMVFDAVSLDHWQSNEYNFGQINNPPYQNDCQASNVGVQGFFFFSSNNNYNINGNPHPNTMLSMANMLDTIPDSNYVLVYSVANHHTSSWPSPLINELTNAGFPAADLIPATRPFIFFYQKGNPSSALQSVAQNDSVPEIFLNTFIGGNWYKGFIKSEIIGPAVQWNSLHWDHNSVEAISEDSLALDVVGIVDTSGQEVVLYTGIQPSSQDFILNINANVYSKIYLRTFIQDSVYRTPAQMKRWQVYYQEVPEALVNPYGSEFRSTDLSQGDSVYWKMPVENVSNTGMSDLLVDFYLYDKDNIKRSVSSPRFHSLLAGDTLNAVVNFSTSPYPGLNTLWMEVNPRNDQPEQFHYNNFAKISFNVNRDVINPILDVTFDGQHILNGDFVSGKPHITIRLKDENKYLALNDTAKYKIFIKAPGQERRQIYFEPSQATASTPELLKWIPAQLPDNTFRIEYNPVFSMDGDYELSAQARDESGNLSGINEYHISFHVTNKSYITNVLNYPNPFTTQTRFVFTLTGSEIPTYFKIQIINISGKVVREITQSEIGPIHIGSNITDFAWDGKDQFGDQLAKGVYLYRVITQINGSDIDKWKDSEFTSEQGFTSDKNYAAETDKFFRKGWGKMYLLK